MKVLNIHKRIIRQPKSDLVELLNTLSSPEDRVWPYEKWPRMKMNNGLEVGSKGGHGPIRYFIKEHVPGELIQFEFTSPKGFRGIHQLELKSLNNLETQIIHTIDMQTQGKDTLLWILIIRCLHDALIEDAFDKVENYFDHGKRKTPWSIWVKICRFILKPKKK